MCGILLLPEDLYDKGTTTEPRWRGPTDTVKTRLKIGGVSYLLIFSRLDVVASETQVQPFMFPLGREAGYACAVNGEIYNYRAVHAAVAEECKALTTAGDPSSMEHLALVDGLLADAVPRHFARAQAIRVLGGEVADDERDCAAVAKALPLLGARRTLEMLHGEFAAVAVLLDSVILARDTYGVRPLYYGQLQGSGLLVAASTPECFGPMATQCRDLRQVPPGQGLIFSGQTRRVVHRVCYTPLAATLVAGLSDDERVARAFLRACRCRCEQQDFTKGRKTLVMLSGGMDSSIVCAVAVAVLGAERVEAVTAHYCNPYTADVKAASAIASGLGIVHHIVDIDDVALGVSNELTSAIHALGTWDTTTIRAGTAQYSMLDGLQTQLGEQLHQRYHVVLGGEGADELAGGYQYFKAAPSAAEAHAESERLLNQIHFYDGLRADRTTAAFGLELRLPFLDVAFVAAYQAIHDRHVQGVEKHRLRQIMLLNVLPSLTLPVAGVSAVRTAVLRAKEAFSDSVGLEWARRLQVYGNAWIHEGALHGSTLSREQALYRMIFDQRYPLFGHQIPEYWMPRWINATDPSATTLPCYAGEFKP
jgi:asparagine synthase (glutamine-hydrolysing)